MKTAFVQVFFYVWLRTWIIFNTCYVLTAGFCIVEFSFTNFDAQDLLIAMIHFKVNNAGISGLGTIENTSLDLFDQIMRINVRYELEEKSLVNCLIIEDRLFSSIIGLLNFCYFVYISSVSVLFNFSSSSISNTNTRLVVSCFGLLWIVFFFWITSIVRCKQNLFFISHYTLLDLYVIFWILL